jgi:hypothetical protein
MSVVLALQNLRADGDISTEGNIQKMNVIDETQNGLLKDILKELKKMNIHMQIITDNEIKNMEVEI